MNTPYDSNAQSRTFALITQHLATLSEASAGSQRVLAQSQTLREWVSERLRERINQVRLQTGLSISNPDAIFSNRLAEDGSIVSKGMTDLLIDTLRSGASSPAFSGAGFYTRHATLEPDYALTDDQRVSMEALLQALMPGLFADYETYLGDQWERTVTHPGDHQRIDTAHQIVMALHREALQCEIELSALCRAIAPAEHARLSSVIAGDSCTGVYAVSQKVRTGTPAALLGAYAITQSPENTDEPSGTVFLVMPCQSVERFESVDDLRAALSLRLSGEEQDAHIIAGMTLSDQGRLTRDEPVPVDAWRFQLTKRPLLEDHMRQVKMKQIQDFKFLLEQPGLDVGHWHQHVDGVQLCAHLDDAMGHRFMLLSVAAEAFMAPDWRKFAKPSDKTRLLALERNHRVLKDRVAKRMAGVESFVVFAHEQLTDYMQRHLGCLIDPGKIAVTLNDTIKLDEGEALTVKYEKTLLEFAVEGLPATREQMSFAPMANHLHAEFSEVFVRTMIADLNLHHRYGLALRQAYEDPESLRQMVAHRDSAIALSAFTAQMQGHLVQDRSHELLSMIRGDKAKEGSTYSIGSLYLLETHTRFNDLIVFEDKTQADEHFVLYAPGAPGGQDFFEFGSWRQLCFGVGGWLATQAGRSYVKAQLTGPEEAGHSSLISTIYLKPSLWGQNSCLFVRCQDDTFQSNLADLVSQKVLRTLCAVERTAPRVDSQTSFASPAIQALMDARIDALNAEFIRISADLVDFRTYVHQHTSTVLNAYLSDNGYAGHVDPDTLYLGLGEAYRDQPDFGEHTELRQLTELMMEGREEILSHRPAIHLYSSTGVDPRAFPVKMIHFLDRQVCEADLGAKYMDFLERAFLGRKSPLYARRKLLMAKRIQYEMSRSALKEFMQGNLHERQYSWLRQTILGLDQQASVSNATSAVSAFQIDGQIIEGVYIFRDFSKAQPEFNLLYTPNAPDGTFFRPLTDYAVLLDSAQMRNYYYGRVAYMGQPRVGSFFERLQRGGKFDENFIRIVNRMENRIPNAAKLYGDMIERMIADVDAQTESHAEARLATAWTVIQWLGDVLLVPFPIVKIAWGVFTSAVNIYQGLDAYISGDRSTALPLVLKGMMGMIKGARAARKLYTAVQLASKGVGVPVGVWVWSQLEFEGKMQKAVNEYLRKQAMSLIVERV